MQALPGRAGLRTRRRDDGQPRCRNVGYRHFEDFFGARDSVTTLHVDGGRAKVVALDSTMPDLDEGEVGREQYGWLDAELCGWTKGRRIVVNQRHILAIPGTGRDVNTERSRRADRLLSRRFGHLSGDACSSSVPSGRVGFGYEDARNQTMSERSAPIVSSLPQRK